MKSVFDRVVSFIKTQVDRIKGFFKFKWEWPKIKTPHFSVANWSLNPKDWVVKGPPRIKVDWYASGGSFAANAPAIIGVGDQKSGYEHVLRDDQIVSLMTRAIQSAGGGRQVVQHITIQQPVRTYVETRRAMRHAAEELAWS